MKRSLLTCAACLILAAAACIGWNIHAGAAGSDMLTVKSINYLDSTITLQSSAGDTVAYISDSKQKTWEEIPGTFLNGELVFDISWISQSTNYTLTFRGDKSTSAGKVVIPKQANSFRVKYKANTEMPFIFSNQGSRAVEWRKDGTTDWNKWSDSTTNESLSYLKGNGTTLYFRLAPVNGTSASDTGMRPSKEVSVKIPAKKDAPSVKVNASAFTVPLTSKMSYRVLELDDNGNLLEESKEWITVTTSRDYSMADILPAAMFSGTSNTATKPLVLQIKDNATASQQESRVATILLPAQEAAPAEDSIELAYTSSAALELTIKAATAEKPYEYCIVKAEDYETEGPDYSDLTWTGVTSPDKVSLTKTKAAEGSHIYVRKKSTGSQGEENFTLASDARDITGTGGVKYPDPMTVDTLESIVIPAGVINKGDYGQTRSFTLYSYAKATVTSIEFKNGNTSYGTVEFTSTAARNSNPKTGAAGKDAWIITTRITSTESLSANENAWNKELYAVITLSNGEKITSTSESGVTLYLYPPTRVENPEEADKQNYGDYYEMYQTDFERIYQSILSEDDKTFKFILDFGTRYKMADKEQDKLAISSISYDAHKLGAPVEFPAEEKDVDSREEEIYQAAGKPEATVCYIDYTDEDGNDARKAYVTIHVDQMEGKEGISHIGNRMPFIIRLNNDEILSGAVYMTLERTATLNEAPIAWTITEGSLKEYETEDVYEDGKLVSSVKTVVNSYVLKLTKLDGSYDVSVSDVTWNGTSILYGASASGDSIVVTLSNEKINQLSAAGGTATYNVVIHFDNGYSITSGCKLTVIRKSSTN